MKSYSGSNAGSIIKPLIDNSKESVWIVSPWLGKEYAKQLAQLSQKGIEVRIITSKVVFNLEALEILKACENPHLLYLVLDKAEDNGAFIHAKIYLADKKFAILGSANLTYSGLNTNIETLSIADTADEVEQIENNFMRLWLNYEKKSLSKQALTSGTTYSIRRALTLSHTERMTESNFRNLTLTYHPYYLFEFIFRGSVRSPPLFFEDKGFFIIDAITREAVNDDLFLEEINNKPSSDYVLDTENKYQLNINQPKVEFREAQEIAYDYIIRKNTRNYTQSYYNRSYERLYVPRKYDVSFLKSYLISLPTWSFEYTDSNGIRHCGLMFASSGNSWQDTSFCPSCNGETPKIYRCDHCGNLFCMNCLRKKGFISVRWLCRNCYETS